MQTKKKVLYCRKCQQRMVFFTDENNNLCDKLINKNEFKTEIKEGSYKIYCKHCGEGIGFNFTK